MWIIKRFADWVDSFGEDAGEKMLIGVVCGGVAGGALAVFTGLALMSPALIVAGFVVTLLHICFVLAVL